MKYQSNKIACLLWSRLIKCLSSNIPADCNLKSDWSGCSRYGGGADQKESSQDTTKAAVPCWEKSLRSRWDPTSHGAIQPGTIRADVELSYIHQPLLSLCICDSKQAKVFSVLLITGADIHIRPGITQCQQREIQNAQNAPVHWWPLRLQ